MLSVILLLLLCSSWSYATKESIHESEEYSAELIGYRVIGGYDLEIRDAPFMVDLEICGGSILGPRHILTAAHCNPNQVIVHVGATNKYDGVVYEVEKWTIHPDYNKNNQDLDVAVITLKKPLQFSENVQPVKLPPKDHRLNPGTELSVMGWGKTGVRTKPTFKLQRVEVPVFESKKCFNLLKEYKKRMGVTNEFAVTKNMFCAAPAEGGKDSCTGDSGGPIVDNKNMQVGIISWGFGCALKDVPGVYVRLSNVVDWIQGIMDEGGFEMNFQ